jgi:hypothetical protein
MEIEVLQTLTVEDYYEQYMFHINKKSKMMYFPYITGGVMLVLGAIVFIATQDYLLGGFVVLFAVYNFFIYPKNVKRRVRNSIINNPNFKQPNQLHLLINDEGVNVLVEEAESEHFFAWSQIFDVVEGENHYYIYNGKNQSIIVHKSHLSGEKEMEFKNLVTKSLPEAKVKFRKVNNS